MNLGPLAFRYVIFVVDNPVEFSSTDFGLLFAPSIFRVVSAVLIIYLICLKIWDPCELSKALCCISLPISPSS